MSADVWAEEVRGWVPAWAVNGLPTREDVFMVELSTHGRLDEAARVAGVPLQRVEARREEDTEFAAIVEQRMAEGREHVELRAEIQALRKRERPALVRRQPTRTSRRQRRSR